ncbi:hypothetical protein ACWEWX_51130 [Streptomyces asiaticus]
MNIDLSGKTAIVTGSTKGIGFATALGLARGRQGRPSLWLPGCTLLPRV